MNKPTKEQMVIWQKFTARFPVAARRINESAHKVGKHNDRVFQTSRAYTTQHNSAEVDRRGIVDGFTPESQWPAVAEFWMRGE